LPATSIRVTTRSAQALPLLNVRCGPCPDEIVHVGPVRLATTCSELSNGVTVSRAEPSTTTGNGASGAGAGSSSSGGWNGQKAHGSAVSVVASSLVPGPVRSRALIMSLARWAGDSPLGANRKSAQVAAYEAASE